jgi:tape measure domain-containing protein
MAVEVSELLTTLRLKDESAAGLAAANDQLRRVADQATKAEAGVAGLAPAVKAVDREFSNAGRSIGAINRTIDGTAAAAAAANRVLAQHADAVAKLRLQHEREGRTAAETAEALRRLDTVRDGGLAKARAAGARVEAQFIAQGVATGTATDQLGRFGSVADKVQRSAESMAARFGVAGTALSALGTAGTVAVAALAATGAGLYAIAQAGDQATATLGKLRAATGSLDAARDVYEALYQSSQKTGIAVADAAGTFARFQIAAGEIGATRDQVLKLVEGLQKVAIVSGTTGQEGAAAMMQLGQALASGRLNGDELRSLMENMPSLAQQLARELGTNIGQLRKMGEEGQLTADKVFPALLRATEKMSAEFDKMPLTMSRSFDILGEAMLDFTAKLDEALGISQAIARAAKAAADAVNGARAVLIPTEREQVQSSIASAASQVGTLRGQIALGANIQAAGIGQLASPQDRTFNTDGLRQQLAAAESTLRGHQQRLAEIEKEGQQDRFGQYVSAQQKAAEEAKTRAGAEFAAAEASTQKLVKLEKDYLLDVQKIDAAERTGAVSAERIAAQRLAVAQDYADARAKIDKELAGEEDKSAAKAAKSAQTEINRRQGVIDKLGEQVAAAERSVAATAQGAGASQALALALAVENELRAAGIPAIEKRTEAEQRAAEIIEDQVRNLDRLKVSQKAADEETRKALAYQERSWTEIGNIGERAMDRVGDAAVNAMLAGEERALNFGNVLRGVAASVAADFLKLSLINPLMNWALPTTNGPRATLTGAFGGGGLGDLLGLSSLMPNGGLLGSLGISGGLSGLGASIFGTPGIAAASFADLGGITIAGAAGTPGLLGMGGTSLMGGSALTLGGAFAGIGGGFAAGTMLNSLLGRSSAQQTNGMIGSGLGSLAGFLIGGPLGGLLGGALGGLGGGLIGPGESVKGYGLRLQSEGFVEGGANGMGDALKPVSRQFYNESGAAVFQQADQVVAAVNAYLAANDLQVGGVSILGGNKDGADYSWADAGSLSEAFTRLRFGAKDDSRLNTYLGGQTFDDPAKLQAAVDGFKEAAAAIDALGAEAVPAFTASLKALNDNFDAGVEQAKKYGLAEDNLTSARAKAIAALEAQRAETLRQSDVSLNIRRLSASGQDQAAELARQAESARQELASVAAAFEALAISAEDKAARLVALEEVQAAERADIIARYGEAAAQALRQAGGSIRAYLDGLLTGTTAGASPTDRLAAAQTVFDRDRTLALGGDRDALGRITQAADALLAAGRDVYASGAGYQDLRAGVTGSLSSLPVVAGYDAMMAGSLTAIQEAIQNGTLNTSTTILPGGNVVQLAGGLQLGGVEAALAAIETEIAAGRGMMSANLGAANAHLYFANEIGVGQHVRIVAAHATLVALHSTQVAMHESIVALHATGAAAHATAVQMEGALYALGGIQMQGVTATATAAQIAVDVGAALGRHLAASNGLLSALAPRIDLAANDNRGGLAALATIAVDASAASALSFAAMNTILANADINTTASLAAANTIAASNATAIVAALNAGNAIAADGNTRLASINSYASFIDNTGKALSNYSIEQIKLLRDLLAALAKLDASVREVGAAQIRAENDNTGDVVEAVRGIIRPLERAIAAQ